MGSACENDAAGVCVCSQVATEIVVEAEDTTVCADGLEVEARENGWWEG